MFQVLMWRRLQSPHHSTHVTFSSLHWKWQSLFSKPDPLHVLWHILRMFEIFGVFSQILNAQTENEMKWKRWMETCHKMHKGYFTKIIPTVIPWFTVLYTTAVYYDLTLFTFTFSFFLMESVLFCICVAVVLSFVSDQRAAGTRQSCFSLGLIKSWTAEVKAQSDST